MSEITKEYFCCLYHHSMYCPECRGESCTLRIENNLNGDEYNICMADNDAYSTGRMAGNEFIKKLKSANEVTKSKARAYLFCSGFNKVLKEHGINLILRLTTTKGESNSEDIQRI